MDAKSYGKPTAARSKRRKGFATQTQNPETKAKMAFFDRAMTGDPFCTDDEVEWLIDDIGRVKDDASLKKSLRSEVVLWLRAAPVLRREGVDIDYASVPQLTWTQ